MSIGGAALALERVTHRFGRVEALTDARVVVHPGTVHALLGENGAGKTTLMRVAFGMLRPDAGTLRVDGRMLSLRSPADAMAAGIGMVHQHFTLVPAMTVAENLALGGHGLHDPQVAAERVQMIALATGFALDPDASVESLPIGAQQRVEIAKALVRRARVLILDEPTAVLAPAETDELLGWLRRYVADGNAAVLITHRLREALAVADDVTVLRRGRVVLETSARDASTDSLTAAMIGPELDPALDPALGDSIRLAVRAPARSTTPRFRASDLAVHDAAGVPRVRAATFDVYGGEIVGVAAVEGGGQRELLRALAGRIPYASGYLSRPHVVGFVPEDRHHDAVLLDCPLYENVALRGAGVSGGVMSWADIRTRTTALMRAFDVRAAGPTTIMRDLSGGNQQKLVLARELGNGMRETPTDAALVVENPTRGLDVRATAAVHARLRAARDAGAAVVLYSSDLDEVLALSSRVLVVHAGRVRERPPDRALVGRAMLGAAD